MSVKDAKLFRQVSDHLALDDPRAVEYDWELIRALKAIVQLEIPGIRLVFAGGAALRSAHNVIQRMSMDADIRVSSDSGMPIPRSKLRSLRRQIAEAIKDAGFVFDASNPSQCWSRNSSRYAAFRVAYEPSRWVSSPKRSKSKP